MPRLFDALRNAGLEENRHWCTDDIDSAVYKGILYTSRSTSDDDEEALVESILLANGKPNQKARAIETSSELMAHLDRQKYAVARLYFDRARVADIEPVLVKFKLTRDSRGESE